MKTKKARITDALCQISKHFLLLAFLFLTLGVLPSFAQVQSPQTDNGQLTSELTLETFSLENISSLPVVDATTGPHIEVFLISEDLVLAPGETTYIGVLLKPEVLWHTYWRNPGDSGEAPVINMSSSHNLSFGEIEWPLPSAIPVAHLVNYGYEAENLLMFPVQVPVDLQSANSDTIVDITADLSWLVCKEDCIPGFATLSISMPVFTSNSVASQIEKSSDNISEKTSATEISFKDGSSTKNSLPSADEQNNSPFAALFQQTRELLPSTEWQGGKHEINDKHIVVEIDMKDKSLGSTSKLMLFPFRSDIAQHAAEQIIILEDNKLRIIVEKSIYFDGQAESLKWLLSDGTNGFYVESTPNIASLLPLSSKQGSEALYIYIIMAFIGGLILNVMPCVLPILSMKAMAMQHSQHSPLKIGRLHKSAYLLGVLACFNAFALLVILLKSGGQQVGWGFHMQEPVVIVLLAFLFAYITLVLLDVTQMGTRLAGVGQSLVSGDTAGSHFATGVLAVIVASPCTAPFMAAALGIAMVSDAYVTFAIFNALALGFALPLTLLFLSAKAKSLLPKPGQWMLTFKHWLAFPMLATVIWLAWVYAGQMGHQMQFLLLLMILSFAMFIWSSAKVKSNSMQIVMNLLALASLVAVIYVTVIVPPKQTSNNSQNTSVGASIAFDKKRLQSLKDDGQVVVVNMTADWCITCKVNEHVAFADSTVQDALAQENVHYMVGDWTNKNQPILDYLTEYKRAGVPLYVVYAGNKSEQVLPQILTPNIVIESIQQAKKEISNDQINTN
ncbi:protein-disulfide reductase DsbD family protein [Glaciecola petra]|uniref:Thioredoxin family protein n=1 Tax=Glaciecola petra TaxID=3075602 RepID=A0ABU2ZU06_9ALTE|nr:thioredoxin family protein [Aestuariibacter sp. P117]MDT0594892.1 thioredoxin family protein [Aestuariibacter sp. P117]